MMYLCLVCQLLGVCVCVCRVLYNMHVISLLQGIVSLIPTKKISQAYLLGRQNTCSSQYIGMGATKAVFVDFPIRNTSALLKRYQQTDYLFKS